MFILASGAETERACWSALASSVLQVARQVGHLARCFYWGATVSIRVSLRHNTAVVVILACLLSMEPGRALKRLRKEAAHSLVICVGSWPEPVRWSDISNLLVARLWRRMPAWKASAFSEITRFGLVTFPERVLAVLLGLDGLLLPRTAAGSTGTTQAPIPLPDRCDCPGGVLSVIGR